MNGKCKYKLSFIVGVSHITAFTERTRSYTLVISKVFEESLIVIKAAIKGYARQRMIGSQKKRAHSAHTGIAYVFFQTAAVLCFE